MTRRLTLVIHSLEGGGAERTMVAMANHWASAGETVSLVTLAGEEMDAYSLDSRVQRTTLDELKDSAGLIDAVRNNWRRVRKLRLAIDATNPDCVIAFTPVINVLTRLACGRTAPVIISERVDPRRHSIGGVWERLRRRIYPRCAALVVQTQSVAEHFSRTLPADKIHVIPNGVDSIEPTFHATGAKQIVAMGRLNSQKGFDLLLAAFAQIAHQFPDWRLSIYGRGGDADLLARRMEELEITQQASLAGWADDPGKVFDSASIFTLPSRYEGFPNSLLEAMATGKAVIAFDCPTGPGEIIRNEVDGLLVEAEDVVRFAEGLSRLMSDEALRRRLGEAAASVSDRYSRERFFQAWDDVIARASS